MAAGAGGNEKRPFPGVWEIGMNDDTPLVRQWTLLRILCARRHGATVREMAQEMGVSDKTIRRGPGDVRARSGSR